MKIAYLSTFYPYRGGIAQFNALLYDELAKTNEVKAFNFKRQYPDLLFPGKSQYVTKDDIVNPIDSVRILDSINPFSFYKNAAAINLFAPDVILTKFWMPFLAPALGKSLRQLNKSTKRISILDNVIPHEKRLGDISLIKFFLKSNDAFIVMSDEVERDLLHFLPKANYTRIEHPLYNHFGNGISKEIACQKLNIDGNYKYLLFFGFIRDYKGLDLLLSSLKNLPEEYKVIIAGEPYGDFTKYDKQIQELHLENRVEKFVRYISDDEVPLFFSAADLCVLPYKSATQSGIVGIAYHFMLPIVATNTGGLKQMIEPYNAGLIAETPTVEDLTKTILDYFTKDKNEFQKGIAEYKKIASWSNLAEKILKM